MTTAQGFTPDDRLYCIEHLTPEARERLGWRWDEEDGVCEACWWNTKRGIFASQCDYADDAAILAEVVINLAKNGFSHDLIVSEEYPLGGHRFARRESNWNPTITRSDIFTAAAAAFRKCKGESA